MEHFVSTAKESSPEILIEEEILKYFTDKIKIWEYFDTTQYDFISLPEN